MATPINYYTQFKFVVEIDGVQRAAFTTCSEPKFTAETVKQREGGRIHPHKAPGPGEFNTITLERGASSDNDLYNWSRDCYDAAAGTGKKVPDLFRNVEIVQLDRDGSELERTILYDAWVKSFSAGKWDNNAAENRITSVELEYDYFEILPV